MNEEPKTDKLAARIAARRRAEMGGAGQPAQSETDAIPAANRAASELAHPFTPPVDPNIEPKIREAREAIASGVDPMKVARLLSGIVSLGMAQKDLAAALGVNKSWLSKRLGLLAAPVKVQQLIEAGGLSESEYHNNKNVESQIMGRAGVLEYKRMPTVTINIESARSLATILRILADKHGASPINLGSDASKKDITSILTYRAAEILELLK